MKGCIVDDRCRSRNLVVVCRALSTRLQVRFTGNAGVAHLVMRDCRHCGGRASQDGSAAVVLVYAFSVCCMVQLMLLGHARWLAFYGVHRLGSK